MLQLYVSPTTNEIMADSSASADKPELHRALKIEHMVRGKIIHLYHIYCINMY